MKSYSLSMLLLFCIACATKKEPAPRMLSVLSFNVGYLKKQGREKYLRLGQVIAESTSGCPDIVLIQGAHMDGRLFRENLPCDYNENLSRDSILFTKHPVKFAVRNAKMKVYSESTGPERFIASTKTLKAEISVNGVLLKIFSVELPVAHAPLALRKEAFKNIEKFYSEEEGPAIIAGSFNFTEEEAAALSEMGALRKHFALSDEMIRQSSTDQGTAFDAGSWAFYDKIALSRNAFDKVECRVVNTIPGQRAAANGAPGGISDRFPVLCRASF